MLLPLFIIILLITFRRLSVSYEKHKVNNLVFNLL